MGVTAAAIPVQVPLVMKGCTDPNITFDPQEESENVSLDAGICLYRSCAAMASVASVRASLLRASPEDFSSFFKGLPTAKKGALLH